MTPTGKRRPPATAARPHSPAGTEPDLQSPTALAGWLGQRRWFARGRSADRRHPAEPIQVTLTAIPLPLDPALSVGLASTNGGDRYQLLRSPDRHEGPVDAADHPGSVGRLAAWIATSSRSEPVPDGTVVGHWPPGAKPIGTVASRPLHGEQSNTSVVVGGTHVLKLFRRVQPGIHPEIEIGRHLAAGGQASSLAPVARLDGWYELEPPDGGSEGTALGVVQQLVPGALDAWGLVLSGLAGDPGALLEGLHHLGISVAHLHGALAQPSQDQVSDPESPEAFGAVALHPERVGVMVGAIVADAIRLLAPTRSKSDALAPVVGRAADVAGRCTDLAAVLGDDLGAAIRHHGDLHLGQVVLGDHGWVILDFEGEPARSLTDRRQRHSPLRDVAGMLRSIDYAAATHRRSGGHHLSPGWEPAARAAFLDGYLATIPPHLLPTSAVATRNLLRLLELEKVVYEIGYELSHRPNWVGLPADGLRRLLAPDRP